MLISTICGRNVLTARPDEDLVAIAKKMRDEHVGDVVIIKPEGSGRIPVGMLTDRDIVVGGLAEAGAAVGSLTAGDVMTPAPVVVFESDTIQVAIDKMVDECVRRLPVVDSRGGLVGIISYDDIVARLAHHLDRAVTHHGRAQRRQTDKRKRG